MTKGFPLRERLRFWILESCKTRCVFFPFASSSFISLRQHTFHVDLAFSTGFHVKRASGLPYGPSRAKPGLRAERDCALSLNLSAKRECALGLDCALSKLSNSFNFSSRPFCLFYASIFSSKALEIFLFQILPLKNCKDVNFYISSLQITIK